jgi:peptide/nickel transport system substrate-binding protein
MRNIFIAFLSLALLQACKTPSSEGDKQFVEKDGLIHYQGKKTNHVVFQAKNDPENLQLMQHSTNTRSEIFALIHQNVYAFEGDGSTSPVLAKNPIIETISSDGLLYNISLHPDAKWEDGSPVTAQDVLFSLKVAMCPLTGNPQYNTYFEYFKDFRLDPIDPKKFILEMKSYYMGNEWFLSNFFVVDKRLYDPTSVMDAYTIAQFLDKKAKWEADTKLKAFAEAFKSAKFGTDPKFIKGLGPYELVQWKSGEFLTLKKKAHFWAKNLQGKYYDTYPDSITFRIIKDDAAAEMAIRQEQLDISLQMPTPLFKKFQEDKQILSNYNLYTGAKNTFAYLCFNLKPDGKKHKKIFTDLAIRQAFANLIPLDNIIETYLSGFAERVCVPLLKSSKQYNKSLQLTPFLPARADSLLSAAGWKDSDNDKVLDKVIDGRKQALEIHLAYGKANKVMEPAVMRIKSELEKAGIKCEVDALEQADLVKNAQSHDFDVLFMAIGSPCYDFKELYHSSAWEGGSNFSGYGNAQTDQLIDLVRTTKDPKQFKILSDSLQKMVHHDLPILLFYNSKGKAVLHKRFNKGQELAFQNPQLNTLMMIQD